MNHTLRTLWMMGSLALALTLFLSAAVSAGPLQDRMKARLPEIVALKSKGVIGETHQGYLDFVGTSRDGAAVVAAENADRKTLYTAIAKKTGATAEQVGSRAALKWKQNLVAGEYYKNPDGNWIQK